jgi:multidrug resistance efflux pump
MSTLSNQNSSQPTGELATGNRTAATPGAPSSFDHSKFNECLLKVIAMSADEETIRREFRNVGIGIPKTLGIGHAIQDSSGKWDLKPNHTTGRCPRRNDFSNELGQQCQAVFQRNSIQIRKLVGDLNATLFLAPISVFAEDLEVLVVVSANDCDNFQVRQQVELLSSAIQVWKQTLVARSGDWKLASLAAIIDLSTRIEGAENLDVAVRLVVNEMSRYVGCPNVALGWKEGRQTRLRAIAGESTVTEKAEVVQTLQQTINESQVRRSPGHWSYKNTDDGEPLLLIHKHLAHVLETESIVSWPLETTYGRKVGSWIFAGPESILEADRFKRLLAVASPRIANALALVERSTPSRITQWTDRLKSLMTDGTARIVFFSILAVMVFLFVPVTYHVRCRAVAQPEVRRFAVAPFEGQIEVGLVRPGDVVAKGQVLARLDGRNIRWQLSSASAEREQAARKREIELAAQNVSEAMLAELDADKFSAQESILKSKLEQLEVKSPIDGVVLSGSLDRAEAASVFVGETLFEVGTIQPLKIELSVPADDVGQVRAGQSVWIWMEGRESQAIRGTVSLVRPISETRMARNVFVAEVIVDNSDQSLRPGMVGSARIDCDRHTLGWNLFHKPWNFIYSQFVW